MPKYDVDEVLAAEIEAFVKKKPFEEMSFSQAVEKLLVLAKKAQSSDILEIDSSKRDSKKLLSASGRRKAWILQIPELNGKGRFSTWRSICDHLGVDVGTDSARRRLKVWVSENKPDWPKVPNAK